MANKDDFQKAPRWAWIAGIIFSLAVVIGINLLTPKHPSKEPLAPQPRVAVAHLPLCTGGTYNFADAKVPGEVEVDFRPDCLSEVTLPPSVTFRTDPSSDIKIIFIDGSPYVDGPGRQVWYGLKRGIFKMHGVTEAGILKISFEQKS